MDAFLKKVLFTCILAIFTITTVNAIELNKTYINGNIKLVLNGQGVRDKFFMDLYKCGLYLMQNSNNNKQILQNNEPINLRLQVVSSLITSDKMKNGIKKGFENSTNGKTELLKTKIETFIKVFAQMKENDIYDFFYSPKEGVKIYKNSNLISTIDGENFKKALFGIWIGNNPAQESLKKDLLGL